MKRPNFSLQAIYQWLAPSWLTAMLSVLVGLVVSVGVILLFNFASSSVQQQLTALQAATVSTPVLTQPGELPPTVNNSLQSNVPLLVLYGFIGLGIYYLAVSILKLFSEVNELHEEMEFVNAHPDELRHKILTRLLIRLLLLVVWLAYSEVFVRRIIPYCLTASHASASDVWSIDGILYALLSFVIMTGCMQLHAVFLRGVIGRSRVFVSE